MNQTRRRWVDDLSKEGRELLIEQMNKYPVSDRPYLICAVCGHVRWMHGASTYSHGQPLLDGPCQNPCSWRDEDKLQWMRGETGLPYCDCKEYEPVVSATTMTIDDLTDAEVFRIVSRDAFTSSLYYGLGVIAILIVGRYFPNFSFELAVIFAIVCILMALLRLSGTIAGLIVEVLKIFGLKPSKPQETRYVWAAEAVRWAETSVYAFYLFLLYRHFYK